MKTEEILSMGKEYVMNTYGRLPLALVRGEGTKVWDSEGKVYLDFVTGLAVTSLGHSNPEIVDVMQEQARKIIHTSNLYWIPNQVKLAKLLVDNSFASKSFFCNSGAEANEGAIKLARKYAKVNYGENKTDIITLKNSFHGRTLAALTATGQTKYQKWFAPLPEGFSYVEINQTQDLEKAITKNTAAVIIEPIQGEGGIHPVEQDFLHKAREVCDKNGALLIFDEVQCGLGRTGRLFAYQWYGVEPDIMTLAKALGNGIPIGALLAGSKCADCFQPGDHASTFGGNPFAAAVGSKVIELMIKEGFLEGVRKKGEILRQALQKLADKYNPGARVRGAGFMLGLPVGEIGPEIVQACLNHGLLINCVGANTLRFLPPLTVSEEEITEAAAILEKVMAEKYV